MIWGCFNTWDLENLVFINDRLTTIRYIDILKENLFHSAKKNRFSKEFHISTRKWSETNRLKAI